MELKKLKLKLNIHKIKDDSLNLGHLVTLKSNPFLLDECDKTPVTLLLSEKSIPYIPLMCIVEVALDFTKQNQESRKFKCKYFVPKKGIFEENWFYEIQLKSIEEKIKKNESVIEMNNKKLNRLKAKTHLTDIDKKCRETLTTNNSKLDNQNKAINIGFDKKEDIDISIGSSVVFKSALIDACVNSELPKGQIISPFMTVKEITMEKNEKINVYDNQTQRVIREVSLYKIKCMWYNPIDSKFSEDWFIPEALIEVK